MSTSDQQGNVPLTRKQLREMRLTGATPVIAPEEAAESPVPPPAPERVETPPAPTVDDDVDHGSAPLTRRQAREQERLRTASVPVITPEESASAVEEPEAPEAFEAEEPDAPEAEEPDAPEAEEPEVEEPEPEERETEEPVEDAAIVSAVPGFAAPVEEPAEEDEPTESDEPVEEPRPIVSPSFGEGVFGERHDTRALSPSFDELITADSTGSQHIAPSTLIFTPSPGDGSLSGPVASTGELLITGSYELPAGLGSQGHARGMADGKDVDVVLIDGELPAASSPTPIAASSAVSTSRPAGEVIRPPAPEKGNKLMFTLAITAGGLALALAVALIVAFSTNVI